MRANARSLGSVEGGRSTGHITVLDPALTQSPDEHCHGHRGLVRADTAGLTGVMLAVDLHSATNTAPRRPSREGRAEDIALLAATRRRPDRPRSAPRHRQSPTVLALGADHATAFARLEALPVPAG